MSRIDFPIRHREIVTGTLHLLNCHDAIIAHRSACSRERASAARFCGTIVA